MQLAGVLLTADESHGQSLLHVPCLVNLKNSGPSWRMLLTWASGRCSSVSSVFPS